MVLKRGFPLRNILLPAAVTVALIYVLWRAREYFLYGTLLSAYIGVFVSIIVSSGVIAYAWRGSVSVVMGKSVRWFRNALILYASVLVVRAVFLYRNYFPYIDLTYYESAVSQFSRFQLARIWDAGSPIWSQHFDPMLFLLVPWYWIGLGGSMTLVIVQAVAAILAAIPLYGIVVRRLKGNSVVGLAICALYLMFGGLQSSIFYGFHPITFFPLLFLSAVYWYERKRMGWYTVFLLLSLFVKEEISFVVIAWGLWLIIGRKDKWVGGLSILLGVLWYFVSFGVIAHFHNGGYEYWGQFGSGSGSGVFGIISFALMHPIQFVRQLFDSENKLPMLIEVFGSFGLLPFLAPLSFIILVPSLLLKLLSHDIAMLDSFHYSIEIAPLLAISAIEGVRRVSWNTTLMRMIPIYIVSVAVLANMYYGFAFYYKNYAMRIGAIDVSDFIVTKHSKTLDTAVASIPISASVSCEYAICAHITRPLGDKLPVPHGEGLEYVIVDTTLPYTLTDAASMRSYFDTKIAPYYKEVSNTDGIYVLKRAK